MGDSKWELVGLLDVLLDHPAWYARPTLYQFRTYGRDSFSHF